MSTDHHSTDDPQATRSGGARSSVAPGGRSDGFELLDEIGRGGMGVVYRARDVALGREVAVKLLRTGSTADSSLAGRFIEEARITGQLQHPGIPPVYQVGTWTDGRPFLAMRLIRGHTLDALLKSGAGVDTLGVFEGICQAVGYAHAHGVIHRDLKPHNVMVGSFAEVQVMDWGLAKVLASREGERPDDHDPVGTPAVTNARDSTTPVTRHGSAIGTPAFMAPEQAAGDLERIGTRTDVFGLGALLCVLLTGRPPYEGANAVAVGTAALRGETVTAFALLDACAADPEVIALCKRCLSVEPSARPADASEVASAVAALRRAADERVKQAERDKLAAEVRTGEQVKRRRTVSWAAAVVAVVMAAGLTVSLWQAKVARREAFDAETARMNEASEKERAESARTAVTAQLAVTAATAAELASKRGRWDEAVRQYDQALELGAPDPSRLRVNRVYARIALGQYTEARAEMDALLAGPDAGPHRGRLLLLQAEYGPALGCDDALLADELARRAIDAGLGPADKAYASVYFAKSMPEAIARAEEALGHDPDHPEALNLIAAVGWMAGRTQQARAALTRLSFLRPNSHPLVFSELLLLSLERDLPRLARFLADLESTRGKKTADAARRIADLLAEFQSEEFMLGGMTLARQVRLFGTLADLPTLTAELNGHENQAAWSWDKFLARMPMFRTLAQLPAMKRLATKDLTALLRLFSNDDMVELTGPLAAALPDGGIQLLHALTLAKAGRLADAEGVCRRALAAASFINHRKRCQLLLVELHAELATNGPPAEREAWKGRVKDDLRLLARSGPLPADWAVTIADLAADAGERELALDFTTAAIEREPKHRELRVAHVRALARLQQFTKAEAAARRLLPELTDPTQAGQVLGALDSLLAGFDPPATLTARLDLARYILDEKVKRFGSDTLPATQTRFWIANMHLRGGDPAKGVEMIQDCLAFERRQMADRPADLARQALMYGGLLVNTGQYAAAVPVLKEYFTLRREGGKAATPAESADADRLYGLALWHTGERRQAAELLTAVYPALAQEGGVAAVSWQELTQVVRILLEYHTAERNVERAAEWKARLPRERLPLPRRDQEK